MAIPKDKDELLTAIRDNYEKLEKELSGIPLESTAEKELEGHAKNTLMSVNNLLAYLIGWGQLVLKWNALKDNGMEADFPETGFKWNQLGLLAQKFYSDYETDDHIILNQKLEQTVQDILRLIEGKTNAELYAAQWYGEWTLGRMIQFNTSSPYKNAKERIRKWKKSKGIKC